MSSRTRGVLWFLVLSFGLAWAAIAVSLLFGFSMRNPVAQLPMAVAPAVAAVVVRRWITREGFADAGLRPRFRPAARYYALAWAGPIAGVAVVLALAAWTGGYAAAAGELLPLAGAALLFTPVFWGEEFGWRSYLQPRLSRRPVVAVLGTGVIWGVWHWPAALTDYVDYDHPAVGLARWTVQTTLLGIVLAWLFVRSGTVWVPCLAHAGSNMLLGVGTEILLVDQAGMSRDTVDLLILVPLAVLAALCLTGRTLRTTAAIAPAVQPHPA